LQSGTPAAFDGRHDAAKSVVSDQAVDRRGFDQAVLDFAGIELTAGNKLMQPKTRPIERVIARTWRGIGERRNLVIERGTAVCVTRLQMPAGWASA
jgi:hypothetical protein